VALDREVSDSQPNSSSRRLEAYRHRP